MSLVFGGIYALVFIAVWLYYKIPPDKYVEPEVKFEGRPCGPWAYFADKIQPRKFEAWKP